MIEEIKKYVFDLCHKSNFQDKDWYWEEHVEEVVNLCEKFGAVLSADIKVLIPAALLHDLGKIIGLKNHSETGAVEAEKYLLSIGYAEDKIKLIKACIREHSFDKPEPISLESQILASCDGASHFTTLFWERYFYDVALGLFSERGKDWSDAVQSNIQKAIEDWQRITVPEIREYVTIDYEAFKRRYKLK